MKLRFNGRAVSAVAFAIGIAIGATVSGKIAAASDNALPNPPSHPALQAPNADADTVFAAARLEFANGNHRAARRLLNGLLTRFPGTVHSAAAQDLLRRVSIGNLRLGRRSGLGIPRALDHVAPKLPEIPPLSGWRTRVIKARPPQDDLAMTSGDRVFFAPSSAELGGNAHRVLQAQAKWLKANPGFGLEIAGHADEPGSAAANEALSMARAKAVRQRLIAEGVAAERLRLSAHGRQKRIAICGFPACLAQNRRVVSEVLRWSPRRGLRRMAAVAH